MEFELKNNYYPIAFLVLIAIAGFIMYSGVFTPKIDLEKYKEVCHKYQTAVAGTYTNNEIQGLVNKINYLFPESVADLNEPLEKEIKTCANELARRLNK